MLAHWMVEDLSSHGAIMVDPTELRWLRAEIVGKGRGVSTCFKVKFSDGHKHNGVPYAHVRRLR